MAPGTRLWFAQLRTIGWIFFAWGLAVIPMMVCYVLAQKKYQACLATPALALPNRTTPTARPDRCAQHDTRSFAPPLLTNAHWTTRCSSQTFNSALGLIAHVSLGSLFGGTGANATALLYAEVRGRPVC